MKFHKVKNFFLYSLLILGIVYIGIMSPNSYALSMIKGKTVDYVRNIDIREGDFIFQHLPGPLTEMIVNVAEDVYSHCGIVIEERGKLYVLEAIGPVKKTPINDWISRGIKDQFTVVRLKDSYHVHIPKIIQAAKKFMGRPYDVQYEWDNYKIYCSELIFKAAMKGAGIRLADFERLGDMKWQPYENEIRYLDGGTLPLEREMITPDAIAFSDKVQTVFSSFPVTIQKELRYNRTDLSGYWTGKYTLLDLVLSLYVKVDDQAKITDGMLKSGLAFDQISIDDFSETTGEFDYQVFTENGVRVNIAGRLDHGRDAIFGRWHDSLGFNGTFHMSRK